MSDIKPTHAYIGRCNKCGEYCSVVADMSDKKKDISKFVAAMIRDGLSVEHVTSDFVREHFGTCKCAPTELEQQEARGEIMVERRIPAAELEDARTRLAHEKLIAWNRAVKGGKE